jgi:hypothetical protein
VTPRSPSRKPGISPSSHQGNETVSIASASVTVEAHAASGLWPIAWDYRRPGNWRAWGFRTWRLKRFLANNPTISSNLSKSDKG